MADQQSDRFRRLPGNPLRFSASRGDLYAGNDHLLLVNRIAATEYYKRFFLRDIQGFVVGKTAGGLILLTICGTLELILFLAAMGSPGGPRVFFIIIAALVFPFFLYNLMFPQTCRLSVQTAAGRTQLKPISRLAGARRFLKRIRPLVASEQGALTSEMIDGHERNRHPGLTRVEPPPVRYAAGREPAYTAAYGGGAHIVLSMALQAAGLVAVFYVLTKRAWLIPVLFTVVLGQLVLAGVAATQQDRRRLRTGLKAVPWIAIAAGIAVYAAGGIALEFAALGPARYLQESELWLFAVYFQAIAAGTAGLAGLGMSISRRRTVARNRRNRRHAAEDRTERAG